MKIGAAVCHVLLAVAVAAAYSVTPPDAGHDASEVSSEIKQITYPLNPNLCQAWSVIEFGQVARADLYNFYYTAVASGQQVFNRSTGPFDSFPSAGRTPPAGKFWRVLSGNAGATCELAAAFAADDWSDPHVVVYTLHEPIASFTFESTAVANEVAFDASASSWSFALTKYEWDFGDGQTGTGKLVTHAYAGPGTYIVKLTVTDKLGGVAAVTHTVGPRLVISQVLTEPTDPNPPDAFTLRVQVRNDGTVPIQAVAIEAALSPDTVVTAGAGAITPASADLAAGASQWFDVPAVAVGNGEAMAVVHASGLIDGEPIAAEQVTRKFAVGGPLRATLSGPKSADQRQPFQVTLDVTNQSGHVQSVTAGTLTASVPANADIVGPLPPGPVEVGSGASTQFIWAVTPKAAGPLELSTTVTGHDLTTLEDTVLQRTATVPVAGEVHVTLTPTFAHKGLGQPGTLDVAITNDSGETLQSVTLDVTIASNDGDGAAEITNAPAVPATIGDTASLSWDATLRRFGPVHFTATLDAVTATSASPVHVVASGSVEVAKPTIGLSGRLGAPLALGDAVANTDLHVVVTNFVPDSPVAIRWAGAQVGTLTPGADGRGTGTVRVAHFPERDNCTGLLQGRQGDVIVDTLVQASSRERIRAADGLTFSDGAAVEPGPRCRGEVVLFPDSGDYLFIGQPMPPSQTAEREVFDDDGTTPVVIPYALIYVKAPGLLLDAVATALLRIERPRAGDGPRHFETYDFDLVLAPDFWETHDISHKPGVSVITFDCTRFSGTPWTGFVRSDHRFLSVIGRASLGGANLFTRHAIQFMGDGTDAPSVVMQASACFARDLLRIWGNGTVANGIEGGIFPVPALYAGAIDVRARSPVSACLDEDAPKESNEVSVDASDGFAIGDRVAIDPDSDSEDTGNVIGFGSLILDRPLAFDHAAGTAIVVTDPDDAPIGCDRLRGAAAIACACDRGLHPAACGTAPLPKAILGAFARGCARTQQAASSTPKKAKHLAKSATATFRKASRLAAKATKRKKHGLSADCAAGISAMTGATP